MLDNSLKYTPAGGAVELAMYSPAQIVEIRFCNTGPGISQIDLPFIFERFFRAERSRSRDAGGSGIGLAINKELIEVYGGKVGAESSVNHTCIWSTLPSR